MRYDVTTIEELINTLGGPTAVAEAFGIGPSAVCNWVARQWIPPSWHVRLIIELRRKRKTFAPDLFELSEEDMRFLSPVAA